MVSTEELTDRRMDTRKLLALRLNVRPGTAHLVHIGGWAADIADDTGEFGISRHLPNFLQDRLLRTGLDDAALVRGNGAKSAATKAPAHDCDRILDRFVGGDSVLVRRVRPVVVGQIVSLI